MDKTEGMTEAEVDELIRIADSGVKERKGYWYTLGILINHHYNWDEQLAAIERLGLSSSRKALDYIKRLNKVDVVQWDYGQWGGEHGERYEPEMRDVQQKFYDNVKGSLHDILRQIGAPYVNDEIEWSKYHEVWKKAVRTIDEAESRLEKSLAE